MQEEEHPLKVALVWCIVGFIFGFFLLAKLGAVNSAGLEKVEESFSDFKPQK